MNSRIVAPALKSSAATGLSPANRIATYGNTNAIVANQMLIRYLGTAQGYIPQAGYRIEKGKTVFNPGFVSCDGLAFQNAPGTNSLLPGAGLMGQGSMQSLEFPCYVMANRRAYEMALPTLFVHDDHDNPEQINLDYVTQFQIDDNTLALMRAAYEVVKAEYDQKAVKGGTLPPPPIDHAHIAETDPEIRLLIRNGHYFTVAELIRLFGKEVVYDREFWGGRYSFLHCISGIAKPIDPIQEIADAEKERIRLLRENHGITVPDLRWFPAGKKTTSGDNPPDQLGLGGNGVTEWMLGIQNPLLHAQYDRLGWVVITGAVCGITVSEVADFANKFGLNALILLSAVEHIPTAETSKLMELLHLKSKTPAGIYAQYQWPTKMLGPAPAGYDDQARLVKERDIQKHMESRFAGIENYVLTPGTDASGAPNRTPIIQDWDKNF